MSGRTDEQIVWVLKGKIEFRLGSEKRPGRRRGHSGRCGTPGLVPRRPRVIDFFAPPRDDFLVGGKPAYASEG
jgi:hypothetical protein